MKVISKRAQNFLVNPQYMTENGASKFQVTLDESGRILTVFHQSNPSEVIFLFSEALSFFAKNKKIIDLWKIPLRELESFLRDENHLPAFEGSFEDLEKILNKTKISLMTEAFYELWKGKIPGLRHSLKSWNTLSLAGKNQWAMELVHLFGWELILCEDTQLTLQKSAEILPDSALEMLFTGLLMEEGFVLPMKVVAV